jgi:hypothetical protein
MPTEHLRTAGEGDTATSNEAMVSIVERRDLPDPWPLRRVLGPSLVLVAVALGSGEFVLWPFASSRAGLGLLWVAVIGLATQFVVNMEIERYTLATGETVISGFTRIWSHWAWIFVFFIAVSWVWPGWVTGAATVAGFIFGWQPDTVTTVSVLGLVAIGIALSTSPVVYRMVERIQWVLMGWVIAFATAAAILVTDLDTWTTFATNFTLQLHPDLNPPLILGLLVFAGAGGTLNLAFSNWVRDKGMGMGADRRPLESPFIGAPTTLAPTAVRFRETEENLHRWGKWWRVANLEHFVLFFLLGFIVIAILSALSAATVFEMDLGQGLDFIRSEGQALGRIGPWLRNLFWVTGAVILFSTNLGILDHLGRLIADIVKSNWLSGRSAWTESKLYVIVVWVEIVVGSMILLLAFEAPLLLMVIAGSIGGVVMFVYSALLIRLNRRALPQAIRLRGLRLWAMVWAVLLFGGFSFFVIWTGFGPWVTGGGG